MLAVSGIEKQTVELAHDRRQVVTRRSAIPRRQAAQGRLHCRHQQRRRHSLPRYVRNRHAKLAVIKTDEFVVIATDATRPLAASILLFDAIIQNPDRRAENPNCLVQGDELRIIDHELAFMHRVILLWQAPWLLGGMKEFERETSHLAARCRATPPRPGVERVRLPGEGGLQRRAAQLRDGVELYPGILAALKPWADRYAVKVPGNKWKVSRGPIAASAWYLIPCYLLLRDNLSRRATPRSAKPGRHGATAGRWRAGPRAA